MWKTSYRLLLEDKPSSSKLQGWAIVENQTESDWNNISLSLVSGRPISFMMDLYQPLYATRPTVVPELFAGLRPQVYADGIAEKKDADSIRRAADAPAYGSAAASPAITIRAPRSMSLNEVVTTGMAQAQSHIDASTSIASIAEAAKLGELFQYTVNGVTLARQKSAMLPIITDSVEVERGSIYNSEVLRTNPLNGVQLKNTTGKHLLQGPVTVLDKGSYAGDARIDNVGPGQRRFLSYGIDLDVVVTPKVSAANAVTTASIRKGLLIITRKLTSSVEYSADNKSDKDKTLVIEHRVQPGWKLLDTSTLLEQTADFYRFKGLAPANKVSRLVIKTEYPQLETIALVNSTLDMLSSYRTMSDVPKPIRDAVARAAELRQAVADADRDLNVRTQQIDDISAEQNRIRENMKTVAQSTQYYERLLSKLNEQESSIEGLQRERASLIVKRDAARKEFDDYLNNLTIE